MQKLSRERVFAECSPRVMSLRTLGERRVPWEHLRKRRRRLQRRKKLSRSRYAALHTLDLTLVHDFPQPLDGAAIRQLIVSGLSAKLKPAPGDPPSVIQFVNQLTHSLVPKTLATFDAIIADYLPSPSSSPKAASIPMLSTKLQDSTTSYFDGLL